MAFDSGPLAFALCGRADRTSRSSGERVRLPLRLRLPSPLGLPQAAYGSRRLRGAASSETAAYGAQATLRGFNARWRIRPRALGDA